MVNHPNRSKRRRSFSDPAQQAVYDRYRADKPTDSQSHGGMGNAYWVGRFRPNPARPFAARNSLAYAAWAAGIDDWREEVRTTPPPQ